MDIIINYISSKHDFTHFQIQSNIIFVFTSTGMVHYDLNYLRYILK